MEGKVLVTYATWAGSTREVAEEIARVLQAEGLAVDVKPARTVRGLAEYTAVVLGSAARMGNLNKEAAGFIKKQQVALETKPLAAFVVCLSMKDDTEENRALAGGYLETILKDTHIKPVSVGLFAGALIIEKLKFPMKFFMAKADFEKGDFRDWDKIRAWAKETAGILKT